MKTPNSVSLENTVGVGNGSQRTLRKRQVSTKSQLTELIIKSLKKSPNDKLKAANTLLFPEAMNFVDEMPLSNRLLAEANKKGELDSQQVSKSMTGKAKGKPKQKRKFRKRPCTKEEVCKKMFDKCDRETIMRMVVNEFDGNEILTGYKEKRKDWNSIDIQQEAFEVLDINLQKLPSISNNAKMLSLQKVLQELANIVGGSNEFEDFVLKVYGHRLKPEKIFQVLKPDELKSAILKNFTASDLLELFKRAENSLVVKQVLEMASLDAIFNEVKSRRIPESSEMLLKALLDKLSESIPEQTNQTYNNILLDTSYSIDRLIGVIINVLSTKKLLRTSETLLHFMLQNVETISSKETKKSLFDVLVKGFKTEGLLDLLREALNTLESKLNQDKGAFVIDISHD